MINIKNVTNFVANKIKELREQKNITQQELAEYIGTTQQSIARYESGERKADQNILFSLSEYFNISIDDFFPEKRQENGCFDEYAVLFDKYKDLSKDDQELIKNIIETRKKQIDKELGD